MRFLVALPLALVVGCAHPQQQAKKETTTAARPAAQTPSTAMGGDNKTPSCSNDLDCKDAQLCIRSQCVDISAGLAECSQVRVGFPLDSDQLDASGTAALQRSARCLKADHALHVTIEGNADERGTEEYNMALGDRRATSVAKYLESLGASKAQLRTVSYGKEKPLCSEHDEACWAQNRRADLNVAQTSTKSKKKKN